MIEEADKFMEIISKYTAHTNYDAHWGKTPEPLDYMEGKWYNDGVKGGEVVKEKYTRLCLYRRFGGISRIGDTELLCVSKTKNLKEK